MRVESSGTTVDITPNGDQLRVLMYGGLSFFDPTRIKYLLGSRAVGAEEEPPTLHVSQATAETLHQRLTNLRNGRGFLGRIMVSLAHAPHLPSTVLLEGMHSSLQEYLSPMPAVVEETPPVQAVTPPQPLRLHRPPIRPRSEVEPVGGRPSRQVVGRVPLEQHLERAALSRG